MAALSTKARRALPKTAFAGPDRSYPVPDKGHAMAAKSRASAAENAGRMSAATEAKIDAKADRVLGKGKGKPAPRKRQPQKDGMAAYARELSGRLK